LVKPASPEDVPDNDPQPLRRLVLAEVGKQQTTLDDQLAELRLVATLPTSALDD
jgi:hypothetical protein